MVLRLIKEAVVERRMVEIDVMAYGDRPSDEV